MVPELQAGTVTNEYGFYSLTLPSGEYEVIYSSIGYASKRTQVSLTANIKNDIALSTDTESLDEVVIETDRERFNVRSPQMSANKRSEERRVGKECRIEWSR